MASGSSGSNPGHAALMDEVYRGQRHIYDVTRKYYLFGRDTLISGLAAQPGMRVLEVACGTGRNLARIGKTWPGVRLFGLDISAEMLKSARAALGTAARLGQGDACAFDPRALLGEPGFERIVLSYSLSMIPDWEAALDHAASVLAKGGTLHVVDFGDLAGLPGPLAGMLRAWLARFHVAPRVTMGEAAARIAAARGLSLVSTRGPGGYYQIHVLRAEE
ncbi:MAG: class I SAM-dependent methyltransferase [Erythrobacteraceae bacterium]|jgi:S-adenosylmethionine-diacylgycerolhomoserine-N-methlytransferase|nr:class I SAM-dependent methyltransferase [Erythrobacteraceae bacterium]